MLAPEPNHVSLPPALLRVCHADKIQAHHFVLPAPDLERRDWPLHRLQRYGGDVTDLLVHMYRPRSPGLAGVVPWSRPRGGVCEIGKGRRVSLTVAATNA